MPNDVDTKEEVGVNLPANEAMQEVKKVGTKSDAVATRWRTSGDEISC